jgi:hypothetical protein
LLASAEGYTPRANHVLEAAREQLGAIGEVAAALAEDLPAPKAHPGRRRRRRRRKKAGTAPAQGQAQASEGNGATTAPSAMVAAESTANAE